MNAATAIFFVLAGLLIIASLMVVFLRRVVHCAIALVTALLLIAVLFISLQAPMVGVLQVMVYAGAIMVLFLFVIMFLNPGALEQPSITWWGVGVILSGLLGGFLVLLLSHYEASDNPVTSTELFGSPEVLAKSLFGEFVLPLEIASVLLLVAIIGAVVLAKREHGSDGAA